MRIINISAMVILTEAKQDHSFRASLHFPYSFRLMVGSWILVCNPVHPSFIDLPFKEQAGWQEMVLALLRF